MSPTQGMDLQALEHALAHNSVSACWCMTSFQNPLGSTMPEAKKEALVRLLAQYEVPLIEDDVYGELYFGNTYPRPAKAFDDAGLVVHCGSFSKSLAPGPIFSASGEYKNCIRLNYGLPMERIGPAIETLGRLAEIICGDTPPKA